MELEPPKTFVGIFAKGINSHPGFINYLTEIMDRSIIKKHILNKTFDKIFVFLRKQNVINQQVVSLIDKIVVSEGVFLVSKEALALTNSDFHRLIFELFKNDPFENLENYVVEGENELRSTDSLREKYFRIKRSKVGEFTPDDLTRVQKDETKSLNEVNWDLFDPERDSVTSKTKSAWGKVQIPKKSVFRSFLVAGLAGAYLFRKSKLGVGLAIGTTALGVGKLLHSGYQKLRTIRFVESHENYGRRMGKSTICRPISVSVPEQIAQVFKNRKLNWLFAGAIRFGMVALTPLVAVHYVVKPLASRSIPVLAGFARGTLHQLEKVPLTAQIGTLLAISALFAYYRARKSYQRSLYEKI